MKSIRLLECCVCNTPVEKMMDEREEIKLFMCSSCQIHDKTKHIPVVFLDGAPAGYVKGTRNPCKNKADRKAFKTDLNK